MYEKVMNNTSSFRHKQRKEGGFIYKALFDYVSTVTYVRQEKVIHKMMAIIFHHERECGRLGGNGCVWKVPRRFFEFLENFQKKRYAIGMNPEKNVGKRTKT